jgi:hypothetical protein
MLNTHFLSESQKVAWNSSKNVSKLLNKGYWCSNKGVNKERAMLDNKMPTSPIWVGLVEYQSWWSQRTKGSWLTKQRNFDRVPSNLLGRPIYGSFGWVVLWKCIPKRLKLGWFVNEQHIHVMFDFLIQNHVS